MAEDNTQKIFLIVVDNCPYCEEAKKIFKPEIERNEISLIKPDDPKFDQITNQLVITKVPACVIEDTKEGKFYYCSEDEERKQKEGINKEPEKSKSGSSLFSW